MNETDRIAYKSINLFINEANLLVEILLKIYERFRKKARPELSASSPCRGSTSFRPGCGLSAAIPHPNVTIVIICIIYITYNRGYG